MTQSSEPRNVQGRRTTSEKKPRSVFSSSSFAKNTQRTAARSNSQANQRMASRYSSLPSSGGNANTTPRQKASYPKTRQTITPASTPRPRAVDTVQSDSSGSPRLAQQVPRPPVGNIASRADSRPVTSSVGTPPSTRIPKKTPVSDKPEYTVSPIPEKDGSVSSRYQSTYTKSPLPPSKDNTDTSTGSVSRHKGSVVSKDSNDDSSPLKATQSSSSRNGVEDTEPKDSNDVSSKKKSSFLSRNTQSRISTTYDTAEYEEVVPASSLEDIQKEVKLTDRDLDDINKVMVKDRIDNQVRSNGTNLKPDLKIVVVQKRKKKIFKVIASTWTVLLVIAATLVAGWGYTVYQDAEQKKVEDNAYAEGVRSTSSKPNIDTTMRTDTTELSSLIKSNKSVTLPNNSSLFNYNLVGWTNPGGTQKESTVEVSFCYMGDGVPQAKIGSAFFFTPDAQSPKPQWSTDTVVLGQELCSG